MSASLTVMALMLRRADLAHLTSKLPMCLLDVARVVVTAELSRRDVQVIMHQPRAQKAA